MNNETSTAPMFDFRAVGTGVLLGLGILMLGGIIQTMASFNLPIVWQVAGSLLGGFLAARRAAGSGWLHGALAGAALMLSVAAVMGVHTALPLLADLLKLAGIGTGLGALGGIAGVNLGGR